MKQILLWVLFISLFFHLPATNSEVDNGVKRSLISFLAKLNGSTTGLPDPSFGWNGSTDPCLDGWNGITCDTQTETSVRRIYLNQSNLSGVFDPASLCNASALATSLIHIKIDQNIIGGQLPAEISNCKNLVRLLIGENRFVGNLPDSLTKLINLQRLDISNNEFSGNLPNLIQIPGLTTFLAQYNQLTGKLPNFDLSKFEMFNVSFNDFQGPIPSVTGRFDKSSFLDNPGLCGPLLGKNCDNKNNTTGSDENDSGNPSKDEILMYSGYGLVGFLFFIAILYKLSKRKNSEEKRDSANNASSVDYEAEKPGNYKNGGQSRSEFSANSVESATVSNSLVVLTSPVVNGLKFEDLLRAPAELLGRGKHSSLYRVIIDNGMVLVVKRIKDWAISSNEFKERMQRIYQSNHPNVLPPLAFYSSRQEKLLVYEYQQNGSLYKFLHGTQMSQAFDWIRRLHVASKIAEALAYMHQELKGNGIAHGNLKSSNILMTKNMEPCISEYGLMVVDEKQELSSPDERKKPEATFAGVFKADVYRFGIILLELLTGKLVQNNGIDLATWVHSVVREEWTVEVFDKFLMSEGASEERMLNLLQVAVKCVDRNSMVRPTMAQVASMINTIKEEEETSITFESMN